MTIHDAPVYQPAKGAFHDPAFGKDFERMWVAPFHNFKRPGCLVLDPLNECTRIAAVTPDELDAREAVFHTEQKHLGSIAVLDGGRMDNDAYQESENIDNDMALDALDLFAGVIPAVFSPGVGLHGL